MTEKNLHVAFIDNICDPKRPGRSGHSDIIWSLALKFAENGHTVKIVGPYSQIADLPFSHENISVIHFEEHRLARRNSYGMSANALRASNACAKENFDYVFTSDAFSAGISSLRLRKSKIVFITSGSILQRQASDFKLDILAETSYRLVSYCAARLTHRIIATSSDMKYWWTKTGAKESKISIIPLGINSSDFSDIEVYRNNGVLNLLFVGRLEGENNPLILIDIASRLKKLNLNFTLSIIGSGKMKGEIADVVKNNSLSDSVKLYGEVKFQDLPEIYSGNHIFLYTRQAGAPPRVILQALTSGLCVVAFRTSGLEDYILNPKMGALIPYGDIESLVETIVRMDKNRPYMLAMGEVAKKEAIRLFDWRNIYAQYILEIYKL